jgi:hypothetical protein
MCFATAFGSCNNEFWQLTRLYDFCGWSRFFPCIFGF